MLKRIGEFIRTFQGDGESISYIHASESLTDGWNLYYNVDLTYWGLGANLFGLSDHISYKNEPNTHIGLELQIGPFVIGLNRYWNQDEQD